MPAVTIEGISKEYVLGEMERGWGQDTFREMVAGILLAPYRRFRHLAGDAPSEKRFFALKDVSFAVRRGEVLGIIGRNGAGKTTLLKILSRITVPTEGRAELSGRASSLLEVGTGFHPELTGRENIFLNGAILGMSRSEIKRKFDEIVAFSEVEKFLDTPVKRYSSGMYVRLAFSIAAHLNPEILIVDEVLAVGDAQFQRKCLGRMGAIGREGRTVLVVSHNMQVIQTLCDRAVWLDAGRLVYDGPARDAIVEYTQSFSRNVVCRTWSDPSEAPGNEHVSLQEARVVPASGSPDDPVTVNTPFHVVFLFRLLSAEDVFNVGIHFRTASGEIAFVSTSAPMAAQAGLYRVACRLPGDLLNNGRYTLDLFFMRSGNVVLFKQESPLVFEIFDTEREPGSFLGQHPGPVRPKLDWNMELVLPC
jgi:homopolymeric O-antigen transport system ATP-binding protein